MILVTGGTGLTGAHLLFHLTNSGLNVRALKRKDSDTGKTKIIFSYYSDIYESLFERIEWVEGDILDYSSLVRAMTGISHVYHAAAIVSFDDRDSAQIKQSNVQGTRNVVEACLTSGVAKLCHMSSIAVFDSLRPGEPISEDCHWLDEKLHSAYAQSKKQSEQYVWQGIQRGLNVIIVNPAIILGPGNWNTGSSLFFKFASKGFWVSTPGGNSFVDVRDVVRAMIQLMASPIQSQNFILSAQFLTFKRLFGMIAYEMGKKVHGILLPRWTGPAAWKLIQLRNLLLPGKSGMTYRTIQSAYNRATYSGQKMVQQTGFEYTPISKTIADICTLYRKER